MKKILLFITALMLSLSLFACGGPEEESSTKTPDETTAVTESGEAGGTTEGTAAPGSTEVEENEFEDGGRL